MGRVISAADFTSRPLADFGQTVVLNRATKTTGAMSGQRTLSYGANTNITAIFLRKNTIHKYDKEGVLEQADAYLMLEHSTSVDRNDKITVGTVIYRVESVIERKPDGATSMFDMATLHKI